LGHSEANFDEKDESDKEADAELVIDVFHGGADELGACTAEWQPEVDSVALVAAPVHNLVVLDHAQFVRLHTSSLHLVRKGLPCHRWWESFSAALHFLLDELDFYIFYSGLDLTGEVTHAHRASDLVSIDVQMSVMKVDLEFARLFRRSEPAEVDLELGAFHLGNRLSSFLGRCFLSCHSFAIGGF